MITKAQAMAAKNGDIFLHMTQRNADGTPVRCRVTGRVQTWRTRPNDFRLPVKHGLRDSFAIINYGGDPRGQMINDFEWAIPQLWEVEQALYGKDGHK